MKLGPVKRIDLKGPARVDIGKAEGHTPDKLRVCEKALSPGCHLDSACEFSSRVGVMLSIGPVELGKSTPDIDRHAITPLLRG